jgi:hypothetical protein
VTAGIGFYQTNGVLDILRGDSHASVRVPDKEGRQSIGVRDLDQVGFGDESSLGYAVYADLVDGSPGHALPFYWGLSDLKRPFTLT